MNYEEFKAEAKKITSVIFDKRNGELCRARFGKKFEELENKFPEFAKALENEINADYSKTYANF